MAWHARATRGPRSAVAAVIILSSATIGRRRTRCESWPIRKSLVVEAEAPTQVQAWLGHSMAMTERYAHLAPVRTLGSTWPRSLGESLIFKGMLDKAPSGSKEALDKFRKYILASDQQRLDFNETAGNPSSEPTSADRAEVGSPATLGLVLQPFGLGWLPAWRRSSSQTDGPMTTPFR